MRGATFGAICRLSAWRPSPVSARVSSAACVGSKLGSRPAKAVENLRLEAARFLLEQGRLPIETIAFETGFGDTRGSIGVGCSALRGLSLGEPDL
jgi:hypothetical protein